MSLGLRLKTRHLLLRKQTVSSYRVVKSRKIGKSITTNVNVKYGHPNISKRDLGTIRSFFGELKRT